MKHTKEIIIALEDLADELVALGAITKDEVENLGFLLFNDYTNDCYKSFSLDWSEADMEESLVKTRETFPYYLRNIEVSVAATRFLQKEFPNEDHVLVDVSW